ncbi:MAG: polysaccharide export protein [Roseivirga sp.]|nr:polysaccharide export protein [Roseivirga sp.]
MRVARYDFLLLFLLIAFSFSSCISYEQSLLLQEPQGNSYDAGAPLAVYKVRQNDLLNINIKSFESSNTEYIDPPAQQNVQVARQGTGNPQLLFNGYSLDEEGRINVPLIGVVSVIGLTLHEIETILEDKLKPYVKFTRITVSLSNFRVTVMGEVNNPGVQYIYEKEYDLLQAIANAGDLTDFANREKVRLLRKDGKKIKSVWLDLTKPEIVGSDYFLLQQGDYIYIEPLKAKVARSNTQNVSLGVSVISLAVTLITLFSR